MQRLFTHTKHFFLLLVALQILNTGLFAQDFTVSASANQNIINSVTEYVAEVVLNKGNVFPEHPLHNTKHHKHSHSFLLKVQQYVLFKHIPSTTSFTFYEQNIAAKYVFQNNIRLQDVIFDITPPPPKA